MSRTLALKYRPHTLNDIRGQGIIIESIRNAFQEDKLPQAILFSGIRGTGKTTLARIIAQTLNCPNDKINSCGQCDLCKAVQNGSHLDVLEIDAASHTSVDNIREIIESAQYKAVQGVYKVYIIDEAHMLSKSAFNALLKNIEEPKDHVYYILATTEIHKIPDTIISRCMQFSLEYFNTQTIKEYLETITIKEGYKIDTKTLDELAYAADGSMRDGITLLDQAILLSKDKEITLESIQYMLGTPNRQKCFVLLEALLSGQTVQAIEIIRTLQSDPIHIYQVILDLVYWLCCLHHIPHLKTQTRYPELDRTRGAELASQLELPALLIIWQVLNKGYEELLVSTFKHQALEMILLRICFVKTEKTIQQKHFETFEQVVKFVKQAREPILYGYLCHMEVNEFRNGCISINASQEFTKSVILSIKEKLNKLTGITWQINIKGEEEGKSLYQQQQSSSQAALEELKSLSKVKDILRTFPEAKIVLEEKDMEYKKEEC